MFATIKERLFRFMTFRKQVEMSLGQLEANQKKLMKIKPEIEDDDPHQLLGNNVKYFGKRYPQEFLFLNPSDFLCNSDDLERWSKSDQSWYLTEMDNRERFKFIEKCLGYLACNYNLHGNDYFEFGCFGANTFRMVLSEAYKHRMNNMRFLAFDSFEGLPAVNFDESSMGWEAGSMAMSEDDFLAAVNKLDLYSDKVRTIKGFYSESLTEELQEDLLSDNVKAALVNIDCDLKKSADNVFRFIEPFLQSGTIVYLDEYYISGTGDLGGGVWSSFDEFKQESAYEYVPFLNVGWWGKAFICKQR